MCMLAASKMIEIPIIGTRLDFTVHGENEDDWEVVSSAVTREQLEEFKSRAMALKKQQDGSSCNSLEGEVWKWNLFRT